MRKRLKGEDAERRDHPSDDDREVPARGDGLAEDEDPELPDAEDDLILDGRLDLGDDELLGESEYEIRASGQGTHPVVSGANRRLGRQDEEDISVDPEELGRRALEEATQDFHSHTEDDDLPEAEWPRPRWGEREMVEAVPPHDPARDRLVGEYSERSAFEEDISDEATAELSRRWQLRQRKKR